MTSHKRAALLVPGYHAEAYFFEDEKFVRVHLQTTKQAHALVYGPYNVTTSWGVLKTAGFKTVDAALPCQLGNPEETHFFCGKMEALTRVKPGEGGQYIIRGPEPVTTAWPCLKEVGFDTVDTVLPSPYGRGETYFFKGNKFVLVSSQTGKSGDRIVYGPIYIIDAWPSLKQAGFDTVDIALPSGTGVGGTYFFRGMKYVLVKFVPGTHQDKLIEGPANVIDKWPSLKKAGFFES